MYFLQQQFKMGYRFGQPTYYSKFHLGDDILCPGGTLGIATLAGICKQFKGKEGGNMIYFYPDQSPTLIYRFLHLSKILKTGRINVGDKLFLTGNTGKVGNKPNPFHLHTDICNKPLNIYRPKNFINPSQENLWQTKK